MEKQLKEIEIPFGAKDSELKGWEYTIPEGIEAEIKDGKIIVKEKESEDEKVRKELISYIKQINYDNSHTWNGINLNVFITWLEKQGEQKPVEEYNITGIGSKHAEGKLKELIEKRIEQKPAEWSEEDENIKESIITGLEMLKDGASDESLIALYNRKIDWLKSFKERYTWKPSEEQMEVLAWCRPLFADPKSKGILESLIEDLKKLMEE